MGEEQTNDQEVLKSFSLVRYLTRKKRIKLILFVLVWIAIAAQNSVQAVNLFIFYKNTVEWYQPIHQVNYTISRHYDSLCTLQRSILAPQFEWGNAKIPVGGVLVVITSTLKQIKKCQCPLVNNILKQ